MNRTLFIFLFHMAAAMLATAAAYACLSFSGSTLPAALLIGTAALFATRPVDTMATHLWKRWFR